MPDIDKYCNEMSESDHSFEFVPKQQLIMETAADMTLGSFDSPRHIPTDRSRISTSSARANYLYAHVRNRHGGSNGSRRSSINSEMDFSDAESRLHGDITEISEQMSRIQQQLSNWEDNQLNCDDKYFIRLKQDNAVLNERINMLEEQMSINEGRWHDRLKDEKQRHKELVRRVERERELESEKVSLQYQLLERDHQKCESTIDKLTLQISALRTEKITLEERVDILEADIEGVSSERDVQSGDLKRSKSHNDSELKKRDIVIEDLKFEIDQLRQETLNNNKHGRRSSTMGSCSELEVELQRLREERSQLQKMNEELHGQLLTVSVAEGKNLLQTGPSLADEIDSMDKDELMAALKEQEVVNQKLRTYVDGILLRIIEMHPAILEVQASDSS